MPLERARLDTVVRGSLFAGDFLGDAIAETADWQALDEAALEVLERDLRAIFARFPTAGTANETQTEDDLIWPVLERLGWTAHLRQQNLSAHGRADVPDGLLFADDETKARANLLPEEWRRYELGLALVESKRWGRPLDRRSGRPDEETAPSTQMLRYLRRAGDLATGGPRWGILADGRYWRLYFAGARSVAEQFFEIDLAALLGAGREGDLFALGDAERRHALKLFLLVFRREAFLPGTADPRTFHRRAIDQGRFHEERVAASLSDTVFGRVFPTLARALAAAAPEVPLTEVREAALVLLYRLLFLLYAEDRGLLPVREARYGEYALRKRVRADVWRRKDAEIAFSSVATGYWSAVGDLCRAVGGGDAALGLPPYNGGLFDAARAPLLADVSLTDDAMADVIDALSFEAAPEGRRYINYRDLGVRQLGSIYERLLEYELVREGEDIAVRPNVFARKSSGSYYTPDELVGLVLRETLGPPIEERLRAFREAAAGGADPAALAERDPAEAILRLRVCDPAMGSGTFSSASSTGCLTARSPLWPRPRRWRTGIVRRSSTVSPASARPCWQTPMPAAGRWTRHASTTATSSAAWCSSAASSASTRTRWRSSSPRSRCGCTRSPSARRSASWTITCAAATACSAPGFAAASTAPRRTARRSSCTNRWRAPAAPPTRCARSRR